MTTAHRPTFDPARGKDAQRGPAYHQRLQPAHTHLKARQAGQGGAADAGRDLRAELLKAEASALAKKNGHSLGAIDNLGTEQTVNGSKRKLLDSLETNADDAGGEDAESKRRRVILEEAHDIDADSDGDAASSEESSDDDDDEGDDEADAMRRELEKIKAERAAKRAAEEAEQAAKEREEREHDIAKGNPLLNTGRDFGVKRRWDDDVVFKNQARGVEEKGKRKEFVNDLLRSDFHKRFMSKYVR